MRELDELLLGYLDRRYPAAPAREKEAFRRLLALPDSALIGYLLRGETVEDEDLAHVVGRIRSRADSG